MFANTAKRARRRGYPIVGYVGPNGSGKSAAAVWDTIPSLESGRPCLSTVRILDYVNPRECEGCDDDGHMFEVWRELPPPEGVTQMEWWATTTREERREFVGYRIHRAAHPLWIKFDRWEQLLEAESVDAILDEVTGVASSRESQGMPAPVANALVQMRRADVTIRWTAPAWARADKIIREVSQVVVYATGYLPKKVAATDGGVERVWRSRRMFKWKCYDAQLFEDFTVGKREQLSPLLTDWHWGPGSGVFSMYDTYDSVSTIGTVSEFGTCLRCNGTRRRHQCKCKDNTDHTHEGDEVAGPPAKNLGGKRARLVPEPSEEPAPADPYGFLFADSR